MNDIHTSTNSFREAQILFAVVIVCGNYLEGPTKEHEIGKFLAHKAGGSLPCRVPEQLLLGRWGSQRPQQGKGH